MYCITIFKVAIFVFQHLLQISLSGNPFEPKITCLMIPYNLKKVRFFSWNWSVFLFGIIAHLFPLFSELDLV